MCENSLLGETPFTQLSGVEPVPNKILKRHHDSGNEWLNWRRDNLEKRVGLVRASAFAHISTRENR